MFHRIKRAFGDMRVIRALCEGAEHHARREGQQTPGAEHFLLSALDLPDRTAAQAFALIGADAERLTLAIREQYDMPLRDLGLEPPAVALASPPDPAPASADIYRASPSGQEVMKTLARLRKGQGTPLLGAHVVAVVADMPHGVAARALRAMGADREALRNAAWQVAQGCSPGRSPDKSAA